MKQIGWYSKKLDLLCKSYKALGYVKGDFTPVYIESEK
jgi:hypothetical protein